MELLIGIAASAVITWFASWWFFRRGKTKRVLAYRTRSTVLITKPGAVGTTVAVDDVSVHWRDVPVDQLTRTQVELRLEGNKAVRGGDTTNDPLRLELNGEDATILQLGANPSRDQTNVSVALYDEGDTAATIAFEFMEPGDSVIFDALHTGKPGALKIGGTMIECPIEFRGGYGRTGQNRKDNFTAAAVFGAMGLACFGWGVGIVVGGKISGFWLVALGVPVVAAAIWNLREALTQPVFKD